MRNFGKASYFHGAFNELFVHSHTPTSADFAAPSTKRGSIKIALSELCFGSCRVGSRYSRRKSLFECLDRGNAGSSRDYWDMVHELDQSNPLRQVVKVSPL